MGRPSVLTCCPGHASEHRESWRQSTSSRHIIPQRKICTRLAALVVPTLRRFEWKGFDFADEARACQPFCCELADFLIDNHDRGDREMEDDERGPGRQQQRGAPCEIVPYPQQPCVRRCACPKPRGVAGRKLALLSRVLGDDAVARMSLHSDRDDRASQSLTPWRCSCSPGPSETFATSDRVLHFQRYGRNPRNHVRSEVETSLSRTCDLRRVESDCESSMGPRTRSGKPSKPNPHLPGPCCPISDMRPLLIPLVKHCRRPAGDNFAANARRCFEEIFNGPIWRRRLVHICTSPSCCKSREEAELKACWAIDFLYSSAPSIPQLAKWTKLLPALIFFVASDVGGVLQFAFEQAKSSFKLSTGQDETRDVAATVGEEMPWHELAGVRFARGLGFLASATRRFHMAALAIVVEPLRVLHSRYMATSRQRPATGRPNLLDEVHNSRSLVTAALQYYSTLFSLDCDRARLVWQWSGCLTARQWVRDYPDEARTFRRLILAAAGDLHRRLKKFTRDFPWLLFGLADVRRTHDDRQRIVQRFFAQEECCLPPGVARSFRQSGLTAEVLTSPNLRAFLHGIAAGFGLSVAQASAVGRG